MPVFKCPVCGKRHVISEAAEWHGEYVCQNNPRTKSVKTQDDFRKEALTQKNWPMNRWKNKEDRYDDITVTKFKLEGDDTVDKKKRMYQYLLL